ncbi:MULTISPECIES: MFS transporter [Streptomyces violaceusniger group]|uniref:MFS transporter n=1 Tax=Streptomyces violaceusniger group TaxID=2839105 RepID=UPI003556B87E
MRCARVRPAPGTGRRAALRRRCRRWPGRSRCGALSDRVGRRPVFIVGALFMAAFAGPFFLMVDTRSPVLICLALVVMMALGHGAVFGPLAAFYAPSCSPPGSATAECRSATRRAVWCSAASPRRWPRRWSCGAAGRPGA